MCISDAEGYDVYLALASADSDETSKRECPRLSTVLRSADNNRSRTVGRDAACRGELRPALYAVRDEVTAEEMRSVPAPYDSTAEPKSKALLLRLGIVWIYSSPAFGLTNMLWQAANENLPDGQYWRTSHCRATRRGSRMPLFTEIIKSRRAAGIYSVPRLQSLNRVGSSAMVPVRTCRRCIVF